MIIDKIIYVDEVAKEAILLVKTKQTVIRCFSCPCVLKQGTVIETPLECIDTKKVSLCDNKYVVQKKEKFWEYKFQAKLINREEGLVEVNGLFIHIDVYEIPNDIVDGMYICFETSRLDIW